MSDVPLIYTYIYDRGMWSISFKNSTLSVYYSLTLLQRIINFKNLPIKRISFYMKSFKTSHQPKSDLKNHQIEQFL